MPPLTPEQCLAKLRALFRDANHADPRDDAHVIRWADAPELWATQQIAHRGWSYLAAECVVRSCRILRNRARLAAEVHSDV